ncbi:hypothetical protein [Streptomyces microflavus]|uniref:hypothetical protein n=1 Tax=Streptomyces microflavus TaxID=1919 RepID=UPI003682715D
MRSALGPHTAATTLTVAPAPALSGQTGQALGALADANRLMDSLDGDQSWQIPGSGTVS